MGPIDFVQGAHKITEGFPADFVVQSEDFFVNPKWFADIPVTVLATVRDDYSDYTDPSKIPAHRKIDVENISRDLLPGVDTDQPVAWVHEYGKGRVFTVSIPESWYDS